MTTNIKYVVVLLLCLFVNKINAQKKEEVNQKDSVLVGIKGDRKDVQISRLISQKAKIEAEEREFLKAEINVINAKLDDKKITAEEAERLKKEAAKKRAANIEDRIAIIDKKIELIKRNPYDENLGIGDVERIEISFGTKKGLFIDLEKKKRKPPKYDIRTTNKTVFAIGFNNAIGSGQSLDDSPYKLGGSGFVELGWVWQTRLFKNSNFARLNYGLSFQWNKLNIKNNQVFVKNGDQTTLQEFPFDVKKAKFRNTNLVIPVHLELGPSKKREYDDRVRYFNDGKFKIGIGGYGGVRLRSQQKIVYEDADGDRVRNKEKGNFNGSNFVYGISGYIGFGDWSIYAKYDLNPIFKDQAFDQNNVSLGLRWDID